MSTIFEKIWQPQRCNYQEIALSSFITHFYIEIQVLM